MHPISKTDVLQILKVANNRLEYLGKQDRLNIEGGFGKHKVYIESNYHSLTGFVSKREVYMFLSAYIEGLSAK